jgi:hypothetical protein
VEGENRDLQECIRQLEQQSTRELLRNKADLQHELEDAEEQLRIVGEEKKMYQMQVDRVLALAGNDGNGASSRCGR